MNDIVVMAPAAVLDLPFTWQTIGERTLLATFTHAGNIVTASLTFNAAGDLVGFLSNDRTQEDANGSRSVPWPLPISGYRDVDGIRVGALGDANWRRRLNVLGMVGVAAYGITRGISISRLPARYH